MILCCLKRLFSASEDLKIWCGQQKLGCSPIHLMQGQPLSRSCFCFFPSLSFFPVYFVLLIFFLAVLRFLVSETEAFGRIDESLVTLFRLQSRRCSRCFFDRTGELSTEGKTHVWTRPFLEYRSSMLDQP